MTKLELEQLEVLAYQTVKAGKLLCGDAFFFKAAEDCFTCVLADGLGSGQYANEASTAVIEVVKEHYDQTVDTLMELCNKALIRKRGAAVAIFKINFRTRQFTYSCVGNIRFFLYSKAGKLTYPLPVTGYLSGRPQIFQTRSFCYEQNSKFLIYSDGLNISGVKRVLQTPIPLEQIFEEVKGYANNDDDTTFIIGSLL